LTNFLNKTSLIPISAEKKGRQKNESNDFYNIILSVFVKKTQKA